MFVSDPFIVNELLTDPVPPVEEAPIHVDVPSEGVTGAYNA